MSGTPGSPGAMGPGRDVQQQAVSRRPAGGQAPRCGAAPRRGDVFAALDLGTNNCRLLVARPRGRGFRVIDAFSRVVRLGEGLGDRGQLRDGAMRRTIDALEVCAAKMRRRRVTQARAVATEACRQARNCDAFLRRVSDRTGLDLEIISQREEAELALAGCAPLLDPEVPQAVVFDIGGGSTQIIWMEHDAQRRPRALDWLSLPLGVVSMAERYGTDPLSPDGFDRIVAEITDALHGFETRHRIRDQVARHRVQMLGSSGTVTTLTGLHLDLPRYDRSRVDGARLRFDTIETLSRGLAGMTVAQRAAYPCVGHERADLVVGGCAILTAICRAWPVGRLRVGDRGVREGILLTMMYADGRAGARSHPAQA
jgi:exopolyphosphatase/guanosine-5'-triphosphate,3'-diphosphate pyrophosphatase